MEAEVFQVPLALKQHGLQRNNNTIYGEDFGEALWFRAYKVDEEHFTDIGGCSCASEEHLMYQQDR